MFEGFRLAEDDDDGVNDSGPVRSMMSSLRFRWLLGLKGGIGADTRRKQLNQLGLCSHIEAKL